MNVTKRQFSQGVLEKVDAIRQEMVSRYEMPLERTTHVHLQCEKIFSTQQKPGVVVQCGVWKGASLFAAALFCQKEKIQKQIFGFDTFTGFPNQQIDPHDHPSYFKTLLDSNLITKEHYEKAAIRTKNFTDLAHLTNEHFLDIGEVFDRAEEFENIKLIKGTFAETLPHFQEPIAVLYIDCDIYQGYKEILENLYTLVVDEGAIVFDEYYSLKYPGARAAVNDFFQDKKGRFEVYTTDDRFERWCFIKNSQ